MEETQGSQDFVQHIVAFFLPIIVIWFVVGIVIAILYHLSLYYLDGEFRGKGDESLDVFVSILRGLLYVVAWPAIFFFDRTALYRIKMLFRYADPKLRFEDEELAGYIAEGKRRTQLRRDTIAHAEREQIRQREAETGAERQRYTREFHEGNPELERIWLMMAVTSGPGGGRELVRTYQERDMADEVLEKARLEVGFRHVAPCEKCGTGVPVNKVELPELLYARVLEAEGKKPIVEGWALRGTCGVSFQDCPECDAEKPSITADVATFGSVAGIIKDLRSGVSIHEDLP